MKRTRVVVTLFSMLFACLFALTVSASHAYAASSDGAQSISFPVSGEVFNPCNGDVVDFTGEFHDVANVTINNNSFHIVFQDNAQGIHGIGTPSGVSYSGSQHDNFVLNETIGASNVTEEGSFTEISQGSAPNFVVHDLLHITVNADGTVTATVDNFTAECRG